MDGLEVKQLNSGLFGFVFGMVGKCLKGVKPLLAEIVKSLKSFKGVFVLELNLKHLEKDFTIHGSYFINPNF